MDEKIEPIGYVVSSAGFPTSHVREVIDNLQRRNIKSLGRIDRCEVFKQGTIPGELSGRAWIAHKDVSAYESPEHNAAWSLFELRDMALVSALKKVKELNGELDKALRQRRSLQLDQRLIFK